MEVAKNGVPLTHYIHYGIIVRGALNKSQRNGFQYDASQLLHEENQTVTASKTETTFHV